MATIKVHIPKGHRLHPKKVGDTVSMPAMKMKCTNMDGDGCDAEGSGDVDVPAKPAKGKKLTPREYLLRSKQQ